MAALKNSDLPRGLGLSILCLQPTFLEVPGQVPAHGIPAAEPQSDRNMSPEFKFQGRLRWAQMRLWQAEVVLCRLRWAQMGLVQAWVGKRGSRASWNGNRWGLHSLE